MLVAHFIQSLGQDLPVFCIVQARVGALFTSLFFLRKEWVPHRVLVGFSVILSVFIMSTSPFPSTQLEPTMASLLPDLLTQIFLGVISGVILNFFVEIFLGLGQIVSMQSGLGFVNFYVAKLGTITPLTQFFIMTATLIFFQLNGHLVLIKMMVLSLHTSVKPMHTLAFNLDLIKQVLLFSKIVFSGSFMLALSISIAVMLANMTLAVMTKFSPQVNVFSIGINISLVVCYFIAYISFDLMVEHGKTVLNELLDVVRRVQS